VIEVLGAVARGFDHEHTRGRWRSDHGVVVVGPPLDGDEALLPAPPRPRPRPVQLHQDHIPRRALLRREHDGPGAARSSEDRHGRHGGRGRDARDAEVVAVAADDPDDRGAVVAPVARARGLAADHAALVLLEVLVGEAPRALDVDDPDARAVAPGCAHDARASTPTGAASR
jgi:hypothetical protein